MNEWMDEYNNMCLYVFLWSQHRHIRLTADSRQQNKKTCEQIAVAAVFSPLQHSWALAHSLIQYRVSVCMDGLI